MSDTIELELTGMANSGEALGRHDNKVIFVPSGVAGDRVRARVIEDRKRYARAELVDLLEASPDRTTAPCPYFGTCGGCQWQHIDYAAQLAFKQDILAGQLTRLGRLQDPPVEPAIGMSDPWAYRNNVQLGVSRDGRLGFMAAQSHDIVPIADCLIMAPILRELYPSFDLEWPGMRRLSLRAGINTEEVMIVFESEDDLTPELEVDLPVSCVLLRSDGSAFPLIGDPYYYELLRERPFRVSAGSFFQVNTPGAEVLLTLVERYLAPTGDETLLDVFCGVGTFGLSLARRVSQVIGIEAAPSAIEDARANSGDVDNVAWLEGPAEQMLSTLEAPAQLAVLDPPREGCPPGTLEALARLKPHRVVYVSCDTATLARDAARLTQLGYQLQVAQPVDMFPQTRHIETVTLWEPRMDTGIRE